MNPDVKLKRLFERAVHYAGEPNPTVTLNKGYEEKLYAFFADWRAKDSLEGGDQRWWFEQTAELLVLYANMLRDRATAKGGCEKTSKTADTFMDVYGRVRTLLHVSSVKAPGDRKGDNFEVAGKGYEQIDSPDLPAEAQARLPAPGLVEENVVDWNAFGSKSRR